MYKNVRNALGGCEGDISLIPGKTQARIRTAYNDVKILAEQVEKYLLDMDHYPTAEEGGLGALVDCPSGCENTWGGPYRKGTATIRDPWGNDYQYACPGQRHGKAFEIWSFGPDGINGNDDDIGSWQSSLKE